MKEKNDKKKLPLGVRLLLLPFKIILVLLVVVLIWFTFCFFDRVKPADALPPDYALYLRTDSVWGTAEPLLDLDATLIEYEAAQLAIPLTVNGKKKCELEKERLLKLLWIWLLIILRKTLT